MGFGGSFESVDSGERAMPKSKAMCRGCRDDYYNRSEKNGCWCYSSAQIVTRVKVGVWQPPPYARLPEKTLSCHRPEGYVWLKLDDCRIEKPEPKKKAKATQ